MLAELAVGDAYGAHSQEIAQDLSENLVMTLENRKYGHDW